MILKKDGGRKWRVMAIALHNNVYRVICYIQDINFNKMVIGIPGLKAVRKVNVNRNAVVELEMIT